MKVSSVAGTAHKYPIRFTRFHGIAEKVGLRIMLPQLVTYRRIAIAPEKNTCHVTYRIYDVTTHHPMYHGSPFTPVRLSSDISKTWPKFSNDVL